MDHRAVRDWMKVRFAAFRLIVGFCLLIPTPTARADAWAEEALVKEADYIVNCSFTEYVQNRGEVQPSDDAYGAFNVLRIYQKGPDWVRPGEAAEGAIGLMAAAIQLKAAGRDITRYDQVLDRFFRTWIAARTQPFDTDPASVDYGGVLGRGYYDPSGEWGSTDGSNA